MKVLTTVEKLVILKNPGFSNKQPKPILLSLNIDEKH
jgi:hypothetical protein